MYRSSIRASNRSFAVWRALATSGSKKYILRLMDLSLNGRDVSLLARFCEKSSICKMGARPVSEFRYGQRSSPTQNRTAPDIRAVCDRANCAGALPLAPHEPHEPIDGAGQPQETGIF